LAWAASRSPVAFAEFTEVLHLDFARCDPFESPALPLSYRPSCFPPFLAFRRLHYKDATEPAIPSWACAHSSSSISAWQFAHRTSHFSASAVSNSRERFEQFRASRGSALVPLSR